MSIGWIAAISYVMVEIVEKIGCLLNVDNYTMGLVVIAIGTSVPVKAIFFFFYKKIAKDCISIKF